MDEYFDATRWKQAVQSPDWYVRLFDELKALEELGKKSDQGTAAAIANAVYGFFEERLAKNDIALGSDGREEDAERKSIDTIIMHHTSGKPGMTIERLNAMHLLRLYVPDFFKRAKNGKAQPIASGHIRNGRQMFYAYHWFIRADGSTERLLNDTEIGWQAGNWEINCRSVAVCFDDDLLDTAPTPRALATAKALLKSEYPDVSSERIFGHREINPKTDCPGNRFLPEWKQMLW